MGAHAGRKEHPISMRLPEADIADRCGSGLRHTTPFEGRILVKFSVTPRRRLLLHYQMVFFAVFLHYGLNF